MMNSFNKQYILPRNSYKGNGKYEPLFVEFDKPEKPIELIKGMTYSFINEIGEVEYGKFIEENNGRLKFEVAQ